MMIQHQRRRFMAEAGFTIPEGLILGLNVGGTLPPGWASFTDADGYYLKGTEDDGEVGTTVAGNNQISGGSNSAGAHNWQSGTRVYVRSGPSPNCNTCTRVFTGGSQYAHSHTLYANNIVPARNNLNLIIAGEGAEFGEGLIGFATEELQGHTPFDLFNNSVGHLRADPTTGVVAQSSSGSTSSSGSSHSHNSGCTQGSNCGNPTETTANNPPHQQNNAGGGHTHSFNPAVTVNLLRAVVRAFELVEGEEVEGLIGMWATADPIPDGWELASELNQAYMQNSADGDGTQVGNNTASFGSTGTGGHSTPGHGYSDNFSGLSLVHGLGHSNSISSSHSGSGSGALQPDRYHIKFIRYVG